MLLSTDLSFHKGNLNNYIILQFNGSYLSIMEWADLCQLTFSNGILVEFRLDLFCWEWTQRLDSNDCRVVHCLLLFSLLLQCIVMLTTAEDYPFHSERTQKTGVSYALLRNSPQDHVSCSVERECHTKVCCHVKGC